MNVCEDIMLMNVLRIFKEILQLVTIVIPVILAILIMIQIIKTISSGDVDTKKLFDSIIKRVVAAVLIFLLPFIINIVMGLFGSNMYYADCYNNANKKNIENIAIEKANSAYNNAENICSSSASSSEKQAAYEEFRVAIKNIPFKETRKSWESKLQQVRSKCN